MAGTPDCRNRNIYNHTTKNLKECFLKYEHRLQKVKELALQIKDGIEKIGHFIQQTTQTVCPDCKNVCCISKHGYYNYEDLVYLHALGIRPPDYDFEKKDEDTCQFLSESGCSLERPFRPSNCNWYFCDSLLEFMEKMPDYQEFDNLLGKVAELWMEMMDEFAQVSNHV